MRLLLYNIPYVIKKFKNKMSIYSKMDNPQLFETILSKSNSQNIEDATKEWEVVTHNEATKFCTCKKNHLVHFYEFKNNINGKIIHIETVE